MQDETAEFAADAPHIVALLQTAKALETAYKTIQAQLAQCGAHTHGEMEECVAPLQITAPDLGETGSGASDPMSHRSPEFEADLKNLRPMELRKKYSLEANSHRSMMDRRRTVGAEVDQHWHEFRAFLADIGPKPSKTATLDRIDNGNPKYGPGLCRWADRRTQNSNKSDSLLIYDALNNLSFTASELAKKQGVKPGTIRERRRRGWTDQEIVRNFRLPPEDLQKLRARFAEEAGERKRAEELQSLQITHDYPAPQQEPQDAIEAQAGALAAKIARDEGEDEVIPSFEFLKDIMGIAMTREQWETKFKKEWVRKKWSIVFFRLPQEQQELAERHFPDDMSLWRRAKEIADRRASESLFGNSRVSIPADE